jgi:hypothetical protein
MLSLPQEDGSRSTTAATAAAAILLLLHPKEHPPNAAAPGPCAIAQKDGDAVVDGGQEARGDLGREEALYQGAHLSERCSSRMNERINRPTDFEAGATARHQAPSSSSSYPRPTRSIQRTSTRAALTASSAVPRPAAAWAVQPASSSKTRARRHRVCSSNGEDGGAMLCESHTHENQRPLLLDVVIGMSKGVACVCVGVCGLLG